MSPKVKKEMRQLLVQKNKAKAKTTTNTEEIQAELRDTMGGSHRHLVDDEDEHEEEEEDVHMYLDDMNPDKRADYRVACRASKTSEWNRQQEEGFIQGKRKIGKYFNLNSFL